MFFSQKTHGFLKCKLAIYVKQVSLYPIYDEYKSYEVERESSWVFFFLASHWLWQWQDNYGVRKTAAARPEHFTYPFILVCKDQLNFFNLRERILLWEDGKNARVLLICDVLNYKYCRRYISDRKNMTVKVWVLK